MQSFLLEQVHDARADVHVRAREDRQADDVGVLLERRRDDLLGRLAQARVDDLHTGVAQGPGDDLGAAVVPVEPRLGNHNANSSVHKKRSGRGGRHDLYACSPPTV